MDFWKQLKEKIQTSRAQTALSRSLSSQFLENAAQELADQLEKILKSFADAPALMNALDVELGDFSPEHPEKNQLYVFLHVPNSMGFLIEADGNRNIKVTRAKRVSSVRQDVAGNVQVPTMFVTQPAPEETYLILDERTARSALSDTTCEVDKWSEEILLRAVSVLFESVQRND